MSDLGIGILGAGNISTAYLRLIPSFRGLALRAIAGRGPDGAAAQAEAFGIRAMPADDLLAADDIDVVVNLTPPQAHFDLTRRALEAGKHVWSEKPFVLTLEQGETLREIAGARDLRVGSAPDTFLGGAHQLARRAVDEGRIGRVTGGSAHIMSRGMESWHPNPDFFFQPGAGPVLDVGPYYLTDLVQILGPVRSVAAMAGRAFDTRTIGKGPRAGETVPVDTPTDIHALLDFECGAQVTLSASWDVAAHRHPMLELYGTERSLYLPDPNFFGGDVTLAGGQGEEALDWAHPFGAENVTDSRGTRRANWRGAGLAEMSAAIAEGRPHRAGLDLALHVVEVMTAILEAGERRDWVALTTTCERPAPLSPDEAGALLADPA